MIQNATRNEHVPGVVVGVGSEVPARTDPGAFPAAAQDQPAVCDLHRPHRRQQGMRRALRLLPALRDDVPARPGSRARRQADHPGPDAPPDSPPRVSARRGQVRRARRRRPPDHAVVLREPLDGRARSLGARPSGTCQRPMRRAQGTVHPEQRRALLRELRRVRRDAVFARIERAAARPPGEEWPRVFRAPLRVAGDREESTSTCSGNSIADRPRRRPNRCPAGSHAADGNSARDRRPLPPPVRSRACRIASAPQDRTA